MSSTGSPADAAAGGECAGGGAAGAGEGAVYGPGELGGREVCAADSVEHVGAGQSGPNHQYVIGCDKMFVMEAALDISTQD